MSASKLLVCYSLGTGAGLDLQLAGMSRQICEDLSEILALNEDFMTVPQMILVRENDEIAYEVGKNATAFAVFYSLPETQWIIDATRAIGGDYALTGRLVDDESGLLLSVNILDVSRNCLLFCGCETCARDKIQEALANMGARILAHFLPEPPERFLTPVWEMIGTHQFAAYINWMAVREAERRAQREGVQVPLDRIAQNLTHALAADPGYQRAAMRLCEVMAAQLQSQTYEFILRYLLKFASENEALALITIQSLARLNRRQDAENKLDEIIAKYPKNGIFRLMRASVRSDKKLASVDLDDAKRLLGNDFNGCRTAVDNALLNVAGV